MENKKTLVTSSVVFLIIGLLIGFWGGSVWGNQAGRMDLMPLVNLAFPKPPDDIRSFTGTVRAIIGATVTLEINDPADYLPHLDNSPRLKQTRYANTTPDTKYVAVSGGKVLSKSYSLSDVKVGDVITVRSGANIKDSQKFDVTEIDLVR